MSATNDIFLESTAIEAEVGRLEGVAEVLAQEAARYSRALAQANHGDPQGYLDAGLHDGYAALAAARQAEADIHEVIRRTRATVHAFVHHDQAATAPAAPAALRTLPISDLPVIPDIALSTNTVASTAANEAQAEVPVFDAAVIAPVVPVPPLVEPSMLDVGDTPVFDDSFVSPLVEPAIPVLGTTTLPPQRVPEPVPQPAVVLLSPIDISTPPLLPPTAPPNDGDKPWWQRAWDMVSGFFAGIFEWIGDLLKGVWDMLTLYWNNLSKGDWLTWGLTILAVVVVIVLAATGVLEVAALIAGVLLAVVGVVVSVTAVISNVQQMQADPEMSDYDKGRLTGRSFMDILSAIASGAGALKLGRAAQVANDLRILRNGATVAEMFNRGYTAEQLVALMRSSRSLAGTSLENFVNAGVVDSIEDAVSLQKAGRLAGLEDWLKFNAGKAPAELADATGELREAQRLAGQYPGSVVRVGRETNAPFRPLKPTERMQEFDISVEDSTGVVQRTVEVTSVEGSVSQVSELTNAVNHAADKVVGRINDGMPLPGAHDASIQVKLDIGVRRQGGINLEILPDGTINTISGRGVIVRTENFFDKFASHLSGLPKSGELNRITLLDKNGNVLATYERTGGIWIRLP